MSADLDRFKTRLNESEAIKEEKSEYYNLDCSICKRVTRHWDVFDDMSKLKCCSCGEYRTLETEEKSNSQRMMLEFHNAMMRNERNNGREEMANAIREVWSAKLYRNDLTADDLIQSAKIYLHNKGK